jgi:hypothetical protein
MLANCTYVMKKEADYKAIESPRFRIANGQTNDSKGPFVNFSILTYYAAHVI